MVLQKFWQRLTPDFDPLQKVAHNLKTPYIYWSDFGAILQ